MRLTLRAPAGFSYNRTVFSHGWSSLSPFRVDQRQRLHGVTARPAGGAIAYRLTSVARGIAIESPGAGDAVARRILRETARRVLNFKLDLTGFHERVGQVKPMRWMATSCSGRMLRAPTPFEDVVKLVLTTNCSWAFTTKMVRTLVERYGEATPDGCRAFPGPEAIARAGERELRRVVRAGYRAPLLARLARGVADGAIDPESWQGDPREPTELRKDLLKLPGVGPYVAENLLRFQGSPAGLGLDSWLRSKYARVYHGGRPVTDRTIARRYAGLGPWGGLALWCDMTRDWFDADGPAANSTVLT